MPGPLAEDGVKGNDAFACGHAVDPFLRDGPRDYSAALAPPAVALSLERGREGLVTLVVPPGADGGLRFPILRSRFRLWMRFLGAEYVQCFEPRRVLGSRRPTGILQGTSELGLVQVFDISNAQDAHTIGSVVDELVA